MIKQQNALILGGGTIGRATGDLLAKMGCSVYVTEKDGCDVMDPEAIRQEISETQPTHVVYTAGVNVLDWIANVQPEDFAEIMAVNLWGFVDLLKALQETGRAYSVVALTSDAATRPMRTSIAYCASKAALDMAIRVASRELASEGWRINGVAPGKVADTGMTRYVDKRVLEVRGWTQEHAEAYEKASSPLGRKISPVEVAAVVAHVLLSEAAAWTGDIVTINGGR